MIRMILIAPYDSLKPQIEAVLAEYPSPEPLSASVMVLTVDQVEHASLNADVVIARGLTYDMLRLKFPDMLTVPMDISGYDIISALHTAMQRFHPKRIALFAARSVLFSTARLGEIFGVELRSYEINSPEELSEMYQKARSDGCDCSIGGLSLIRICGGDAPCVMIETGSATIHASLDEAVRLVLTTRAQHERSTRYQTILDHSKDGILSLAENGRILSRNHAAQQYLLLEGNACIGKHARDALPFAEKQLAAVFSGARLENEIFRVDGRLLSFDFIPTLHGSRVTGAIIFLSSVNRIQEEEALLRKKVTGQYQKAKYRFPDILCRSEVFSATIETARIYAGADSPVLIFGESGTGKELLAQSIHNASARRDGPFIAINCAALSESLLESELFGYSDGAFTGALKGGKEGLFEAAHGGTIFLDEISEIPVLFQSKLLRVLQEREVRRIGVSKITSVDVRVIAATNRDLRERVRQGEFRQDLLFRLNVLNLFVPPLRSRKEDIIGLFELFVSEYAQKYQRKIAVITGEAKALLEQYPWEGNVREVRNVAERICVLSKGEQVTGATVYSILADERMQPVEVWQGRELGEVPVDERELLRSLLERYDGNKSRMAKHLGIDRSTLWRKMKKYHLP